MEELAGVELQGAWRLPEAEQALPVLCVGEGHRRGGTMVTDTYNSGLTLERCLNCQLYPERHLDRCCGMTDSTHGLRVR